MDPSFLSSYDPTYDWTAERPAPAGCGCSERTPHSFDCDSPSAVAELLEQSGYRPIPVRSPHEHARLVRFSALAVVYKSGAVVAQGGNPAPLLAMLAGLAGGE